jgi:hypothetical protein
MQMEKDWSQVGLNKANMANDLKTMDRMMADDWAGIDFQDIFPAAVLPLVGALLGVAGPTSS